MAVINHQSPTARSRINQKRIADIAAGFYWASKNATFDADPMSLSLVTGRAAKISAMKALNQVHPDFLWRDQANVDHTFTADEFLQFAIDLDSWVEARYIESWQAKAAL